MEPLRHLVGPAIPLGGDDIDTDVIFPARFLLLMERDGLGRYLFNDRRYDANGDPRADFILNEPRYAGAAILIAGHNFGTGSSREQAVWALHGHGIRCVIAPSFGRIFHGNCLNNGLLPLRIEAVMLPALLDLAARGTSFEIDLERRELKAAEVALPIPIEEASLEALLNGWDETDLILARHRGAIIDFEAAHRRRNPWLFLSPQRTA